MGYDMMISVIVPVYQVERYLDQCVESIAGQTYRDLEVILVDDGSPDGCPALCDAWAARDSRIRVIHKANGGAASARNVGLDHAGGDYIAFVEVKLRRTDAYGTAGAFVDRRKQEKLRTSAQLYLAEHPTGLQPRFDVVEIMAPDGLDTRSPRISRVKNAF